MRDSPDRSYDAVAQTLHWLIALAIIAMLVIGWEMVHLPKGNPLKFGLFQWHKSIGITILLLSLLRLLWRLAHRVPPLPAAMPGWEKAAAQTSHALLYILMIGMPLVGWIIVSASTMSLPTMLYGVIHWPNLPVLPTLPVPEKKAIGETFVSIHNIGAFILAGLLVLHVGAALKHHWWNRDAVLMRMTPEPVAHRLARLRGKR